LAAGFFLAGAFLVAHFIVPFSLSKQFSIATITSSHLDLMYTDCEKKCQGQNSFLHFPKISSERASETFLDAIFIGELRDPHFSEGKMHAAPSCSSSLSPPRVSFAILQ
jgi:hypothetical protein